MNRKFFIILILLAGILGAIGIYLYILTPTAQTIPNQPAPKALVASCGDIAVKEDGKAILAPTSHLSKEVQFAISENATAVPSYIIQLFKKADFKIAVFPADAGPSACKFSLNSPEGRPVLCANMEEKQLTILLNKGSSEKVDFASQVNVALLSGVFSLVYDYFWHLQDNHHLNDLASTPGIPVDASEKPLNDYQKFEFWRYRNISKLRLFAEQTLPFLDFKGSGPLSPAFVRRGLNLLSSEYYCRPESHKKFSELHPDFYKEFSTSLACVFGKPWFMKNEDYLANCPKTT
jgi:hypothetical protein